jgi:hypothetical protein
MRPLLLKTKKQEREGQLRIKYLFSSVATTREPLYLRLLNFYIVSCHG